MDENINAKITWENNGQIIDSVMIIAPQCKIRDYIIEFLQNKPNHVLQKDWSKFGEIGDCIKINI
ncbi:MAG: hypothetical protein BWY15_01611 [Firmicutes bacterium ADurb.Bin193]|nr:MAG: hypothetical protein BWY15_01611 [Firmicutes bacterium ADurb.Bin193]